MAEVTLLHLHSDVDRFLKWCLGALLHLMVPNALCTALRLKLPIQIYPINTVYSISYFYCIES